MIILLLTVITGTIYLKINNQITDQDESGQVFCTKEAKLCPDGSTVGRQGPDCEFEECLFTPDIDETT